MVHSGSTDSIRRLMVNKSFSRGMKLRAVQLENVMGISWGYNWMLYIYWLVVLTILKNISQWEGLSHILWKIKNVPNHQPVYIYTVYMYVYILYVYIYYIYMWFSSGSPTLGIPLGSSAASWEDQRLGSCFTIKATFCGDIWYVYIYNIPLKLPVCWESMSSRVRSLLPLLYSRWPWRLLFVITTLDIASYEHHICSDHI